MKKFAKLYEFADIGQVLVFLTQDENNEPVVEFHFDPDVDGLGVCVMKLAFEKHSEDTKADAAWCAFEVVDEERAYKMVKETIDHTKRTFGEEQ